MGSRIHAFDWCQNQPPWWPWTTITHSVSEYVRFRSPTRKLELGATPPICGSIRFVRIIAEVSLKRASNDSGVVENGIFSTFPRYFFRSFSGKANIGLLFSPSPPLHWLQNTWPWVTVKGHFTLNSVLFCRVKFNIYGKCHYIYSRHR